MTRPARPPDAPAPALGARLAAASREDAVRERFVRAVLAEVPLGRVAELHLFAPMRQGGVETGVAVVAARLDRAAGEADSAGGDCLTSHGGAPAGGDRLAAAPIASTPARHTVYTARYRLTLKGPDRGRWQVDVRAEADAPLLTVDAVVRGVQRRAGDATAPARFDAAACAQFVAPASPHAPG